MYCICRDHTHALTEQGRLSGASLSGQIFEDIPIISNHSRIFAWALHIVNMQVSRL